MITVLLLFALVGAPVFLALLLAKEFLPMIHRDAGPHLEVGDGIVYRMQKVSTHPSPRAYEVHPAGQGDTYSYFVDKFWTVENVLDDGRILVTTRTRKRHCLRVDDPNLRKAGFVARLRHWKRFPRFA